VQKVYREEWIGEFRFIEYEDYSPARPSYMIIALPDAGLVSVIAASHMIKKLGMEEVGGVDSYTYLPPVIVVHKGNVRPPVRIFTRDNLLLIYTEFLPASAAIPALVNSLLDYGARKGIDNLVCMTGIPIPNRFEVDKLRSFYVPSNPDVDRVARGLGIEPFENGFLVGPYAILFKEALRRRMNAVMFLTESFMEFPDPEASAKNLTLLSRFVGVEIDVKELLEQAELIRLRAREHMKRVMPNLAQMRKEYEYAPPLYT